MTDLIRRVEGKTFHRTFEFDRAAVDAESREVDLAFSSEAEYERFFGIEILDHSEGAVRLAASLPLCKEHDTADQIGVAEDLRIDSDRVGRARARFSRRPEAEYELQDILDGIRGRVSVGYIVHKMVLEEERSDGPDVYRVTDWEPIEVSIVTIPADTSVGVGRSEERTEMSEEIKVEETTETPVEAAPATEPTEEMSEPEKAPEVEVKAEENAEVRSDEAAQIVKLRRTFIRNGYDAAAAIADEFIEGGRSAAEYQERMVREMETKTPEVRDAKIDLTEKEERGYSFMKLIRALGAPSDKRLRDEAGFEFECSAEVAERTGRDPQGAFVPENILQRDMVVGTDSAGGYLKDTKLDSANFIELLRDNTLMYNLGAKILSGLVGDVAVPKQTGGATAYWVAESGAVTESQQTLGQISLSPKTVGAYTDLSRKFIKQSSIGAEAFVREDLAKTLAIAIDLAALNGSGTSNQPTGILNTTGIGSVNWTTASTPTRSDVLDGWDEVAKDNALLGALHWVTNSTFAKEMMQVEIGSATSGFLLDNGNCEGYPLHVTNQAPAATLLFGNFSDLVIGEWGGLDILVDPYTASTSGTLRVVALKDVDVAVRHPESFCAITNA